MQKFYKHRVRPISFTNRQYSKTLWGIEFRCPLINSAGMFKDAQGYDMMANQGAGGYIGGTSTFNPRAGNTKLAVKHPFLSLAEAEVSLNFLGLPNLGDIVLSKKIITNNKIKGCPIGWSLMRSPDYSIEDGMEKLVESLWLYHNKMEIDFIEINESCPNVNHITSNISNDLSILENRLRYIAKHFLSKRKRHLPVVLKLADNLYNNQVRAILDTMFECKFDGVNFVNTSTNYSKINIADFYERRLFDYYTNNIGGGVGGKFLKHISFDLCVAAIKYRELVNPGYEFHVIRTGGISKLEDILASNSAGISLNQWYTGYFENYTKYGDQVYAKIFS